MYLYNLLFISLRNLKRAISLKCNTGAPKGFLKACYLQLTKIVPSNLFLLNLNIKML